jgi:hypothetical protein
LGQGVTLPKISDEQIKNEPIYQPIYHNWFEKHLHLTWLFYMIASLFIDTGIFYALMPDNPSGVGKIAAYVWMMLTPFVVDIWLLRHKNRSWAWSLFTLWALSWIPLLLKNKSGEVRPAKSESAASDSVQIKVADDKKESK